MKRNEEIFAVWMQQLGIKNHHIIEEIERLRGCETMDDYFRVRRIGSTLPLTRIKRRGIWSLYENAKRHASAETEMKLAGVI